MVSQQEEGMTALNWSSPRIIRSALSLRGIFMWILVLLLLTGAASYTHGSRYALIGHGPFQTAEALSLGPEPRGAVAAPAVGVPGSGDIPASAVQVVRAVHQAGQCVDPQTVEGKCCDRRQAPRGEPAPLRTGAVDPPTLLQRLPGDAVLSSSAPPEPDLPTLTVFQLSISRT